MKLGVSMYSYVRTVQAGQMDIPGFIREAKRIGAEGVELLDFFYKDVDRDREAALQTLEEVGLPCGVFSVAQNFAKPSAEDRAKELQKILFGINEAQQYGAKVVRVFAGDTAEDIDFNMALDWIIDGLTAAADVAHSAGIKLALENHGKLAGRGDQVRKIVDAVQQRSGNDALGANPDTGNFLLVGQKSDEAIAQVAHLANMVHFKDFEKAPVDYDGFTYKALDGTGFRGTVIGEGDVDLAACLQHLVESGFNGWVNLEYEGEGDPIAEVEQSYKNSRKFVDEALALK